MLGEESIAAAIQAGDQATFAALAERYRRQLRVHCYRMVGSFDEAEDLVQESLLRAWRAHAGFAGRAQFRTWLYRIATNTCLNALERAPRRVTPQQLVSPITADFDAAEARSEPPWAPELPWLQPYPDSLLEPAAPHELEPEAQVVKRETIELAFVVALQQLPPRQRAILILRDVLDWSARETAEMLETSVASVNSAHQRARATLRSRQPSVEAVSPTAVEHAVLGKYMAAMERADAAALVALLREDVRWAMPPAPLWFEGAATMARVFALLPLAANGEFRLVPAFANRQPGAAVYRRPHGTAEFRLSGVHVMRVEGRGGAIAEMITFGVSLCRGFGLPETL
jgi:RNA polymerase sigma-70 factor (ECF subfamily)